MANSYKTDDLAGISQRFTELEDIIQTPTEMTAGRWLSVLGGGALLFYGIVRHNLSGTTLATLGGGLLYYGACGKLPFIGGPDKHSNAEQSISTNVSAIPGNKGIRVHRSLTINRSPEELYTFWHDVEQAPAYIPTVDTVKKTGARTSQWRAISPFPPHKTVQWNSELLEDKPGELIAWHAHGKSTIGNAGKVTFTPATGGRGTTVTLELDFFEPKEFLNLTQNKLTGKLAEYTTLEMLRHFKDLMEAGEIPTVKGQPTGAGHK